MYSIFLWYSETVVIVNNFLGWSVVIDLHIEPVDLYAQARNPGGCDLCGGRGFLLARDALQRDLAKPCECRLIAKRSQIFNACDIPSLFYDATLDNFSLEGLPKMQHALKKVSAWIAAYPASRAYPDKRRGLLFYGSTGTGKTRLVCAMLRQLIVLYGVRCKFIEFVQLLNRIKRGYDQGEPETNFLLPLVNVDVLAIDELGKGRQNTWADSILDDIIVKRYFAQKLTFFTTNYFCGEAPRSSQNLDASNPMQSALGRLEDRIDKRVYSRIVEMCEFVDMDMPDYRTNPRPQSVSF